MPDNFDNDQEPIQDDTSSPEFQEFELLMQLDSPFGLSNRPNKIILTVSDIVSQLNLRKQSVYALAKRESDPLPLRNWPDKQRNSFALPEELSAWVARNAPMLATIESMRKRTAAHSTDTSSKAENDG